jgi:hypothetical protein
MVYRPMQLNECLHKKVSWLKTLVQKLATGESTGDC